MWSSYADDIVLVANSGMELQTMLDVMWWRMKFNSRKSKIMVVGKSEGWKIGEEVIECVV